MIINKTKGTTISQKEMICRTVFSQARGLMLKNFKPFTFWTPQKEGRYVVELARCGEYEIGDLISLKNHKDEK
ncbi:hypothetical protein HYT55_00720 [Candidatus Woesearchaeota archaeon]|nr:hypothetical protein [Candidatus Woesearchaeota archaeon]